MTTPIDWVPLFVVYLILTSVAVSLRLWIRIGITKSFGQDDAMLLMAQTGMIAHFAVFFAVCAYYPRHGIDIDEHTYRTINVLWFWATFCYAGAQVALKMSMGLFFLALARLKWQRLLILIPTVIFVGYNTILAFIMLFRCGTPKPFEIISKSDCAIDGPLFYRLLAVNSAFNAVIDWIFAITPIFMILRARSLEARARRAIWFLVLLAMAGSVVSIVRIPYIKDYQFGPTLWRHTLRVAIISATENAIGTIAISMATMKPLIRPFRRFCRKFCFLSTSDSERAARYPSNPDPEAGGNGQDGDSGAIQLDARAMHGIGLLPDTTFSADDDDWTNSSSSYTVKTDMTSSTTLVSLDRGMSESEMHMHKRLFSISEVPPTEEETTSMGRQL